MVTINTLCVLIFLVGITVIWMSDDDRNPEPIIGTILMIAAAFLFALNQKFIL